MQKESFRHFPHNGYDFAMPIGTPLRSIQEGTILKVVDYGNTNVGKGVFVQWEDGKTAIYGHMSQTSVVPGQHVDVGTLLGYSGSTGHSTGPHLHFGLQEGGRFIDPSPYVDHIQNMNHLDTLTQLAANHAPSIHHVVQTGYTVSDLFKGQMQSYMDFLSNFKMNFIHFISSIDYTVVIQHLQHIFHLFLG
jgi:hypothetical protein